MQDKEKRKLYEKRYRKTHKKESREYQKEYYLKYKDRINQRHKEYYYKYRRKKPIIITCICGKEIIKKWNTKYCKDCSRNGLLERGRKENKIYYQENKYKIIQRTNNYRKEHKEEYNKYTKNFYKKHPERRGQFRRKRKRIDKDYKLKCNLRARVYIILKKYTKEGKIMPSGRYGIDYKAIIEHLKPFPKNIRDYHIHHIKPLCSFKFINQDGTQNLVQIKEAFKPENHRWVTIQEHKEIHKTK